jgi:hypothetical protein
MDINPETNLLVTASIDNVICLWNNFSATEWKKIPLPKQFGTPEKNELIQYVRYPFADIKENLDFDATIKKDLVMVIMNNG